MIYPERYHIIEAVLRRDTEGQFVKGAEIGVRHADVSEYLLKNFKKLKLLLIDPYAPYNDLGYQFTKEEQDKICKEAKTKIVGYGARASWLRMTSVEAAAEIADGSLDFVFIDGEHTYTACLEDIYAWYPKLRAGGYCFLHDISMDDVKKAANEWCSKFGKTLDVSDPNSDIGVFKI